VWLRRASLSAVLLQAATVRARPFRLIPPPGTVSYPQWCTVRLLVPPCGPGDILTMAHCNSNGRVVVKFKRGASSMARVLGHQANC
jgi:hypothetical protein